MSIQGNVNQALSIAGLLATQSGRAANVKTGKSIQGRQKQAIRGLEDIGKNVRRAELTKKSEYVDLGRTEADELKELGGPKKYNDEEFKNILERTNANQRDIYDAKTASLNPSYKRLINPNEISQEKISSLIDKIRGGIDKIKNDKWENYKENLGADSEALDKAAGDLGLNSNLEESYQKDPNYDLMEELDQDEEPKEGPVRVNNYSDKNDEEIIEDTVDYGLAQNRVKSPSESFKEERTKDEEMYESIVRSIYEDLMDEYKGTALAEAEKKLAEKYGYKEGIYELDNKQFYEAYDELEKIADEMHDSYSETARDEAYKIAAEEHGGYPLSDSYSTSDGGSVTMKKPSKAQQAGFKALNALQNRQEEITMTPNISDIYDNDINELKNIMNGGNNG